MPPLPTLRVALLVLCLFSVGCQPPQLTPGEPLDRLIEQDDRHRLRLDLEEGAFYHLVAQQPSADVVLTLYDPAGERIRVDVDATTLKDPEHLYFIPPASGRYTLEVHGLSVSASAPEGRGRYRLDLKSPRPPDATDLIVEEAFWEEALALELDFIKKDCGRAIVHYGHAARLWEDAGRPAAVALVLIEMADCQRHLGMLSEAERAFLRALELAREVEDSVLEMVALKSLGSVAGRLGRLDQALNFLSTTVEVARRVGQPRHIADALNNLCSSLSRLGRFEAAVDACAEALEIFGREQLERRKVRTLGNLASVYLSMGALQKAVDTYEAALSIDVEDRRLSSKFRYRQASVLAEMGRGEEALLLMEEAMAGFVELEEIGSQAQLHARRAELLFALGRSAQAASEADAALQLVPAVENVFTQFSVFAKTSRLELDSGDLEQALALSDRGFEVLERVRRTPPEYEDRIRFFASHWELHDVRVTSRMALFAGSSEAGWRDAALHTAEGGRALELVGLLERTESQDDFERVDPVEPGNLYRELLGPKDGLLHFHLGRSKSFLWRWVNGQVESFVLPPADQIGALAADFQEQMTARDRGAAGESGAARARRIQAADRETIRAAEVLSRALRLPEAVSGQAIRRWVIVPDGALHRVPFVALTASDPAGAPWRPLIDDFEIVYAPSLTSLAGLRSLAAGRVGSKDFLAVADPVFSAGDPRNS
ncbi:MAG: tetratricopeptide repeat protein, partial [Acidobacteriota bacterium]